MDTQALTGPAIAMLVVLVICSLVLAGLVVTLPAVTNRIRRLRRLGKRLPHAPVAGEHRA